MADSSPNSALTWFPRISRAGLPVPRTRMLPFDHAAAMRVIEGEPTGDDTHIHGKLLTAVTNVSIEFGFPTFARSDLTSAKHDGPTHYRIDSGLDVGRVIAGITMDNEMKFWLTGPEPQTILVRKWIDIESRFEAFGGLPIGVEFRYFATTAGVTCRHFYWPAEAIAGHADEGWEPLLEELAQIEPPEGLPDLAKLAVMACADIAPEWSVDFARDRQGMWWLIDMALADESWHPEH